MRWPGLALLVMLASASPARADLWCANPLLVHEWGVIVFGPDGAAHRATTDALPPWFHTPSRTATADPSRPVRELPADNGVRKLPIVHFYTAEGLAERGCPTGFCTAEGLPEAGCPTGFCTAGPVPLGLEVGFTQGAASVWYPAVDALRAAALANGPASLVARAELIASRASRSAMASGTSSPLPADPTRQLVWDRLDLARSSAFPPRPTDLAWITRARALDEALWVNGGAESERFVFYEAATTERVPLLFVRKDGMLFVENRGPLPVHDVFVTNRARRGLGDVVSVVYLPTLAAGARARVDFGATLVSPGSEARVTTDRLRASLVAPHATTAKAVFSAPSAGPCVTMRDPAVPIERASGATLFSAEVDLLLSVWGARFFEAPGVTVLYREDTAALDAAMPLSVYTDMRHYPVLHRAGLALWEGVRLP